MRARWMVLLAVGCGMDTGLPSDRLLVDLTQEEVCQLRDATDARFDTRRMRRGFCTLATAEPDTCAEEREVCEHLLEVEPASCSLATFAISCTASVGDWEECVDAVTRVYGYAARVGCDLDGVRVVELETAASARCQQVSACL